MLSFEIIHRIPHFAALDAAQQCAEETSSPDSLDAVNSRIISVRCGTELCIFRQGFDEGLRASHRNAVQQGLGVLAVGDRHRAAIVPHRCHQLHIGFP